MIYFDNAATTFPKPESVYVAAERAARRYGGNPGRSSHRLAYEAAMQVYECREEIASLFGGEPEQVVLTMNATYALNLAIHALAKPRGTILISSIEHNAVLRPVAAQKDCRYEIFSAKGSEEEILAAFKQKLDRRPALVVCNHVSNLCGLTLPVEKIGALCRQRHVPFIIDASQSAGHRPLTLGESGADAICAPGHKGLYGLQGSGFVLFSEKYRDTAEQLQSLLQGGNGVNSKELFMPDFLPERMEAGTLPTPALAALAAGIREVKRVGLTAIASHEEEIARRLIEGLSVIRGVDIYGGEYRGGTVLFRGKGILPESLCEALDEKGFCLRGGYHCCPLGHQTLGTPEGGAVRASFSMFNRRSEVDALLHALTPILRERS